MNRYHAMAVFNDKSIDIAISLDNLISMSLRNCFLPGQIVPLSWQFTFISQNNYSELC